MNSEQRFDLSSDAVPSSWQDAASHGPQAAPERPQKPTGVRVVPSGRTVDVFSAILLATVVSMISTYLWFEIETSTGRPNTWIAIPVGVALAIAIRLGGGSADPQVRAAMAAIFYLITAGATLFLVGRSIYSATDGQPIGLLEFENQLINTRLSDATSVLTLILGAAMAVGVSYALRRNR